MRRQLLIFVFCIVCLPACAATEDAFWSSLKSGAKIVLIRHAQTVPGIGDPPGFALHDCSTQRNLSEKGRADAAKIGAAFRRHAIPVAEVLSSRWCRCLDTAKIAFGSVKPAWMLDSMFNDRERSDEDKVRELFRYLAKRKPGDGNLVLVTHSQNIIRLTGLSLGSGEMVVAVPGENGKLKALARLEQ